MNEEQFKARNHSITIEPSKESFLYSIRMKFFIKFGIWDIWDLVPFRWNMYYYDYIKPFFFPCNKRIRKVIPRQWVDITSLIVDVNFEFIKAFYEDEFTAGIVDWDATEHHKEFADWLTKAYNYLKIERIELQNQLTNSYPATMDIDEMFKLKTDENGKKVYELVDDGIPYDVKYKEVNRLEKLINEKDTDILIQLIKRRDYFWT